jgi:hypothetical protein
MCIVAPIGVPYATMHLLVCHVQCGIYWCSMCSVAPIGVPCAVWHLLVCHVQCGICWCAMCSVASIGVHVLLTLISLVSVPGLLYHCKFYCYFTSTASSPVSLYTSQWERKMVQMACMSQCRRSQLCFFKKLSRNILGETEKISKIPPLW